MNNLPAMTEEQRQELIRHNRAKVNAITPPFLKEVSPGVKKHLQSEIDTAKIAIAALTADGWIKCSERMPEVGQEVILFNGLVRSGYYYTEYGDFSDVTEDVFTIGDATHWMPLPPPPEASNEQ